MVQRTGILLLSAVLSSAAPLRAANATHAPRAHHPSLAIDSRVAKFETFYSAATAKPRSETSRWKLWKADYGIAAVPPGPPGDVIARKELDAAWPRYRALVPRLPALTERASTRARALFTLDNELLGTADEPIHSRLVLFVGEFDDNAFTVPPMDGRPATVVMPVENSNLTIALAHELAHSINLQLVHVKHSFGAPVGETMFLEGLAMRTAERAVPGLGDAAYTAMPGDRGWFAKCRAREQAVLRGIAPDLDKSGSKIALKYTFGKGNTGMPREVYCAAWIVMGRLLDSGWTLPKLARVPEDRMIGTIRSAMQTP